MLRVVSSFPGNLTLPRIHIPTMEWAVGHKLLLYCISLTQLSCVRLSRCLSLGRLAGGADVVIVDVVPTAAAIIVGRTIPYEFFYMRP